MTAKAMVVAPAPKDLRGMIASPDIRQRFESILGKKAQAFASSIISVSQANKALQECEPSSIISSALLAASLDLPIVASLGQAALVPYSGKATFQIMARGFVQLALRSGQYKTMNASEVYEGQLVSRNKLTGEVVFNPDGQTGAKIVGFVFYFKLVSGYEHYEFMTVEEAQAHGKKFSKSYGSDSSQWKQNFSAMALKTVVKKGLSKWGPLSTEMQTAIEFDQSVVGPDGKPDYIDAAIVDKPTEPEKPIAPPVEAKIQDPITFHVTKGGVSKLKTTPVQFSIATVEGEKLFTMSESIAKQAKQAGEDGSDCRGLLTKKGEFLWIDSIDIEAAQASTF